MDLRFLQVDVFTDRMFGGNPLAVFPDADGLTSDQMQSLALEMNLSETTFVLKPKAKGADFRVRIFTPDTELPFAGHPVVGTHWVLAKLGRVNLAEPSATVTFELGVGVLPATLQVRDGRVERVVMTQDQPVFGPTVDDVSLLARGLGTDPKTITDTGWTPQVVSTGMGQMMVGMRSLADVQKLSPRLMDSAALNEVAGRYQADVIAVFCLETSSPDRDVHVRGFASPVGIPEDPATGSANGALGAYLVRHKLVDTSCNPVVIRSEQGLEMGRPSFLDVEVDHDSGIPHTVRVGGTVVPVIEGTVHL